MKKLLLFICIFFTFAFFGSPKLDASSEEAYLKSLNKIFENVKTEEQKLEIAKAILFVVQDGKEDKVENSTDAYNLYKILSFMGQSGKLMLLQGKNAEEMIAAGFESRKKWVQANLPKEISYYENKLEKNKQVIENKKLAEEAVKVFTFGEPSLKISHINNIGEVDGFTLTFDVNNPSDIEITTLYMDIIITDSKDNTEVNKGNISVYSRSFLGKSESLEAKTSKKIEKDIRFLKGLTKEENRYIPTLTVTRLEAGTVTDVSMANSNIADCEKKLAYYKQELEKYK